ncbi:MAG: flagellar hook-basal body complex protein FliE [Longimicrobiales bacterium]
MTNLINSANTAAGRLGPRTVDPQEVGRDGLNVSEVPGQDQPTFADTLRDVLGEVGELNLKAQDTIGAFLRGEPVETHRVMAAAEEAGIALEMLIEVRNKITEAYRAVMQMQS